MTMITETDAFFPAIRARIGDWWYYVCTLTLRDVAERVSAVAQIHEKNELKTWIQRDMIPSRLDEISHYIHSQPQHFFNALVLGTYGGEPGWFPVTVSPGFGISEGVLGERTSTAFGLIKLTGKEQIFAIDGQHRVEGIKLALKTDNTGKLAQEEQAVIFVAHKTTEEGRERTRRLFSTLNKYAKPVSKGEIIALSEDDTFAVVTRKLIDEYPGLESGFIPLLKTPNLKSNDKKSITSVISLYEVVKIIALPPRSRERRALEVGPPVSKRVAELYTLSSKFWDSLKLSFKEIRSVCSSKPNNELAGKYRHSSGGHLLFRPVGLTLFAKATRVLLDRGFAMDKAVKILSRTQMELSEEPWKYVLWDPNKKNVILKNTTLARNLLLKNAKQKPEPQDYDVGGEYHKVLGEVESKPKVKQNL